MIFPPARSWKNRESLRGRGNRDKTISLEGESPKKGTLNNFFTASPNPTPEYCPR